MYTLHRTFLQQTKNKNKNKIKNKKKSKGCSSMLLDEAGNISEVAHQ